MKQLCLPVVALVVSGMLLTGCTRPGTESAPAVEDTSAAFDLAAARRIIEQKNEQFTRAHVTGDRAAIDRMFTEDARALPPNADPVIGRAAIDRLTAEYLEYGISEFREETVDFYGNEELLIDQGDYLLVYGPDNTVENGKYLNVWVQENGDWKIRANIWNTNSPPLIAQ